MAASLEGDAADRASRSIRTCTPSIRGGACSTPASSAPMRENDRLLEKLVVEFLRDHVYWRRNFHPEDPPAIPTHAAQHPEYLAFEARLRRELHQLSAALKKSVPFHSPRYLGHMVSDLLLPGLAAQMLTLPYNPNNVSEDAAPVTVDMEVQVGLQLARMFGYPHDPARSRLRVRPPDLRRHAGQLPGIAAGAGAEGVSGRAARREGAGHRRAGGRLDGVQPRARRGIALLERWTTWLATQRNGERRNWREQVQAERIEQLGIAGFFARHPRTARADGAGADHRALLVEQGPQAARPGSRPVAAVARARHAPGHRPPCEQALADCARDRQPVLLAVAVLGTTEYGTVDPVDAIVDARDRWQSRGLGFRRARRRRLGRLPGDAVPQCRRQPAADRRRAPRLSTLPAARSPRRVRRAGAHRFDHRRSAQARLPAVWRRRFRLPRPSADGVAGRSRRLRLPHRFALTTTSRATGSSGNSFPKARRPVRLRRRSTLPTRCCRWTTNTSACCRGRPCSRRKPSMRARRISRGISPTSRTRWCRSHPTATLSAWRSIRSATATWPAPMPSCARCTTNCAAIRASRCSSSSSSARSPRCAQKRWARRRCTSILRALASGSGDAGLRRRAGRRPPGHPAPHLDESVPHRPRERHQLHRPVFRAPRPARSAR